MLDGSGRLITGKSFHISLSDNSTLQEQNDYMLISQGSAGEFEPLISSEISAS